MASRLTSFFDTLTERRAMRRWATAAAEAERLDIGTLKSMRGRARAMRREIDRVLRAADVRLAVPAGGMGSIPRPLHSDWAWRPDLWRVQADPAGRVAVESPAGLAAGTTLFHDCRTSEITLRQSRNRRDGDLAPFGLRIDVLGFDGSFLSLVTDLPDEALRGLQLRHVIRLATVIELEQPIEIFARLNVRHGPNTEQIVRELPLSADEMVAEFDLAYSKINEKRVEKAWIDLIFEGPAFNQITVRDLTLTRRPRAEI